jgi:hypothetical protein
MIKIPNDSLTETENVSIYILKHLDVNHFIDISMEKICDRDPRDSPAL